MAGDTQKHGRVRAVVAVCAFVFLPTNGLAATTALYSLGYGAQSSSMAGATLASGSDALNQFGNPANLSFIPKRLDLSVMYLRSDLHFKNALNDKNNERGFAGFPLSDNNFLIPALGVSYPLTGTNFALGFQLYGLGGDATRFILDDFPPPAGFGAKQRFRANLVLMNFGPALAYKVNDRLSLGATFQVTAGRLKLDQPFGTFDPPTSLRFRFRFNMDDYGFDFAFGGRVSATLKPTQWLTLAIAYQTPREFEFAGDTRLTFPAGVGLGV
ncbi:MAG: OmpP1/FadL family transporter, partial [Candidatus Binatia bacterium]